MRSFHQKNKKAVALIFFTLIFATFLGYTMLIMNTGRVIYQKIRLQSAVDLAAYAGASVQASYLGNGSSAEDSIRSINQKIKDRYSQLLEEAQSVSVAPPVVSMPSMGLCMTACAAANAVNAENMVRVYREAVADIAIYHEQVRQILREMPRATQEAVEETMRLNIAALDVSGSASFSNQSAIEATNNVGDLLGQNGALNERKNAVLTFTSNKGAYLSNVVASVPHAFTFFGPMCFNQCTDPSSCGLQFYCAVNGRGAQGGPVGLADAMAAYGQGLAGGEYSGNLGRVGPIAEARANAIRLHFIEDAFKPQNHVTVAAEWYPETGNSANLENLQNLGQEKGALFPRRTRLVAISTAEPFGAALASNFGYPFGTRLTGIRKKLLDPRMASVRGDYGELFEYMQSVGPLDSNGQPLESPEQVIQRFLH